MINPTVTFQIENFFRKINAQGSLSYFRDALKKGGKEIYILHFLHPRSNLLF